MRRDRELERMVRAVVRQEVARVLRDVAEGLAPHAPAPRSVPADDVETPARAAASELLSKLRAKPSRK